MQPLWTPADAATLLGTYGGWMSLVLRDCLAAWVALAAIQMIYAAAGAQIAGRPINWLHTLGYPIAALVCLLCYQDLMQGVLEVFLEWGKQLGSMEAVKQVKQQEAEAMTLWGRIVDGVSMVTHAPQVGFMKGFTIICLCISTAVFYFLEMFQVSAIGILYILGPAFVLCLCFQPTSRATWRWATCYVEVCSWPLIWRVIMMATAAMGKKIKPTGFNPADALQAGRTFQQLVVVLTGIMLTLMVPVIARILIGGGLGAAIGMAGLAATTKAAQMGGSATAGAAVGGAVGGASGALEGGMKAMANSAGIRTQDSPQMAGAKRDAMEANRDPAAAAGRADQMQAHRDPAAAGAMADQIQAHRDPQQAADWQDAVHHLRRTP